MNKNKLKALLPVIAFVVLLIPIATSSLLDLEQKKIDAELKEAERIISEQKERTYLMGKFDQTMREDFAAIPTQYVMGPNKMYLRKETLKAYLEMRETAKIDGVDLRIASATRNFKYQAELWNNKWDGTRFVDGKNLSISIPDGVERFRKILEYSAAPGSSRHHWGTDIDINGAEPAYFDTERGIEEYDWLTKNAPLFGFCQVYDLKDGERSTGYNEEKWHWSYLPLAKDFTKRYGELIKNEDMHGFLGEEYAPKIDLVNDYVLAINPSCR